MLFRLVYFSNNLLRRPRASAERQLTKLLHAARHTNASLGITGALLFDARHYAQVLEGERSHVSHLFCRICADPRHHAVTIVEAKVISERSFAKWSMALVRADLGPLLPLCPGPVDGEDLTRQLVDLLAVQMDAIVIDFEQRHPVQRTARNAKGGQNGEMRRLP
jgi:hypothetical protein